MKTAGLIIMIVSLATAISYAQSDLIMNTPNRDTLTLNGQWHYIVDPYENGFYNYRYQTFDSFEHPSRDAYFMNAKPTDKSDRIEYDFNASDTIQVPGDWNSQKENLFYYEGTVWYKTSFDFVKKQPENRVFLYRLA